MTTKKNSSNKKGKYQVVILKDYINEIDIVLDALQNICGHNYIQAGSCITIAHNAGRCSVFVDSYEECDEVLREFLALNIKTEIQKYKPISNDNGNKKSNN